MFENPRRGREARNFTTNVPKILDLKSSSEQIFSENWRRVPLERGAKWQISLKKVRKNPTIFCMLIRVPLFANSNFPSNSWGTNFGFWKWTFILISRRHFVKNRLKNQVLVFVTLVTWPKLVVSVFFTVATTIWRSEVFSVHVCKYWSLFVLKLGFLCCGILLGPYVKAWCLCILCTIASWRNGISLHVEIQRSTPI